LAGSVSSVPLFLDADANGDGVIDITDLVLCTNP
jgi:hypothetical protein